MFDREEEHLAPGQIIDAAAGQLEDATAEAHLETCAECGESVKEWRDLGLQMEFVRAAPVASSGGSCPSMEDLANFGAGIGEPDENVARHVGECGRCAAIIRGVDEPGGGTAERPQMALTTSSRKWRVQMARTFAGSRPSQSERWRFAAIAAIAVAVAGSAIWWSRARATDPSLLLAQAYTAARPFEYRLPDAGYASVSQKRGYTSTFDRPESLVAAESEIRRRLAKNPEDAYTLELKGRSLIMESDYNAAIDVLKKVTDERPGDPDALADLGTAHMLRASLETHTEDYGHALDLFLRALKIQPTNQPVLFNLALLYERLSMVDDSIQTWQRLIGLHPAVGWLDEAETHLKEEKKILQDKKKADAGVLHDPSSFLAAFGSGKPFDPLPYYDIFWMEWLPKVHHDEAARKAAQTVAAGFHRFGEDSLQESIPATGSTSKDDAILLLASAMAANRQGHTETALSTSRAAAHHLEANGLHIAALLADIELAYALRREPSPRECVSITTEVIRAAGPTHLWLGGTAHLEHVACVEILGDSGASRAEAESTRASLVKQGLWPIALRAKGFVTGMDQNSGNDGPVWDNAPEGLREYWTSPASVYRAQNFQFDLENAAFLRGWKECAVVFYRAAIRSTHVAGNHEIEASDRADLAGLLQEMGDYDGERQELDEVDRLLNAREGGADPEHDRARENLRWEAKLRRAEADIATRSSRDVAPDLEDLAAHSSSRTEELRMRVEQARGLAILKTGDWRRAEQAFEKAIELSQQRARSLPLWINRIPVLELASPAYRNLAELELTKEHDAAKALATWREFRPRTEDSGGNGIAVTIAFLPSGLVVWSEEAGAVQARSIGASSAQLRQTSERFLTLCATPASSPGEIHRLGNELYRALLVPELETQRPRTIRLATESWLAAIPFAALTDNSGSYLSQRYAFVEDYGPERRRVHEGAIASNAATLVVSAPSGMAPGHTQMPVLAAADREAAEVASRFSRAVLVKECDLDALSALALKADVFHFSGHGWSSGGNGALILPPGPNGEPRLVTSRSIARQDWSKCQLAVLSACLTATGEERGAVNNQSLVQAMFSAGARRVIAARWSVDSDATRALMEGLYTGILSGKPVPEALSGAAQEVAASPNWSHPYFWAGFDVFGAA